MAFDQGASRPRGTITAKSTGAPQNAWHLKLKKIQRIQRIQTEKNLFQVFFYLIIFIFCVKSGGGAKKCGAAALPAPPPPPSAVPERLPGFWFMVLNLSVDFNPIARVSNRNPRIFGSIQVAGKLPTYPSPKLTLTLTSRSGQNDGLGEGQVRSFPET